MNYTKLFALAIFCCSLSGISVLAQKQDPSELELRPYRFTSRSKEKVETEIGRFKVPENRKKPNGKMIELAFIRFKSTSKNPGSPIVYLAGGPGGSGTATARGTRFPLFMAMREIGDVIAFDQRGTGLSKPSLRCSEPFEYPVEKVPDREAVLNMLREQSRTCAERLTKEGIDLSGYNSNESADDLEDLRKALGAKKLSLWAISYGTHLSLATVKRHENSIDRLILAGVEGLHHTIKLPGNIQKHVETLDRLAKADPDLSRKMPSLSGLMKKVLDEVEKKPAIVETVNPATKEKVKVTINKFALQVMTSGAFGRAEAQLPIVYHTMSKGDFSLAARSWMGYVRPGRTLGSAMSYMMDCHSGISAKRRRQVTAEAATTLLGGVINLPFPNVCSAWGNPDSGKDFRTPVKTKVPTLFISGTLDVRTPPSNAEEVRAGFTNSSHLIIDGAVHSDPLFLSSPKIKETMLKFMRKEELPSTINIKTDKPFRFQQIG